MTKEEQLASLRVKVSPDIVSDDILLDYLQDAQEIVLNRLYEVAERPTDATVPTRYQALQVRIALELYAKRGAEGETKHDENGISRTYASASVSPHLLKEIKPFIGTVYANTK